jgi:hypothetical protein
MSGLPSTKGEAYTSLHFLVDERTEMFWRSKRRWIRVDHSEITSQGRQAPIFECGGSIRDRGLVQCETKRIYNNVWSYFESQDIQCRDVDKYEDKPGRFGLLFYMRMLDFNLPKRSLLYSPRLLHKEMDHDFGNGTKGMEKARKAFQAQRVQQN